MNSDLRILSGCADWNNRMKRFAACAPGLDIFGQGLVVRDNGGWQLTDAGRAALVSMEMAAQADMSAIADHGPTPSVADEPALQRGNVIDLDGRRRRRSPIALDRSA